MGYSKEIYDKAEAVLNLRREKAKATAQAHKDAFYSVCPRAAVIEKELSRSAVAAAKCVLGGSDVKNELQKFKDYNLSLQKERAELLKKNNFPDDYLLIPYTCKRCKDSGFINGKACECFRRLLKQEEYKKLNELTPLELSDFDGFSLSFYETAQDRERMEKVFSFCKKYASEFSVKSRSILMLGGTGLGKTHLSLSIAKEAIDKGFGVVYGSIQTFSRKLENERFKDAENSTYDSLTSCDLLIIDDLGTEASSEYIISSIYDIINTRLMKRIPTVISTNLSVKELEKRYSERFISRIIGNYEILGFSGKDIRTKLRLKNF